LKRLLFIFAFHALVVVFLLSCQPGSPEGPPEKVTEQQSEAPSRRRVISRSMAVFEEKKKELNTPAGLTLTISVPKKRFYMGEPMPVTFTYEMQGEGKLEIWGGTYDRSGRISDINWYTSDAAGKSVPDPLEGWSLGGRGGGKGHYFTVTKGKPFSQTFYANEWLRFDRPGNYTIAVISWRISGCYKEFGVAANPIQIGITTIEESKLDRLISEYEETIPTGTTNWRKALSKEQGQALLFLRFLHHRKCFPLYFKCLIDRTELASPAMYGLFGYPDRGETLQLLEKEFARRDYRISSTGKYLYEKLYRIKNPSAATMYYLKPKPLEMLWNKLHEMAKGKTPSAKAVSILALTPAGEGKPEFSIELAKCLKDMPEQYLPEALRRLGLKKAPEVCSYVVPYLKHKDLEVRSKAVSALIKQDKNKYTPILLEDMMCEKQQYQGHTAYIEEMPAKYQKRLAKLLQHSDYNVQARAARLLRQYATSRELKDSLLTALDKTENHYMVKSNLLRALAKIDLAAARDHIIAHVKNGGHDLIDCLEPLIDQPEVEKLFLMVAVGDRAQYGARNILAKCGKLSLVPVLLDALAKKETPLTRCCNEVQLLEKVTGHLFEFTRKMKSAGRARAIEEWKSWWEKYKDKPEPERIKSNIEHYVLLLDIDDWLSATAHSKLRHVTGMKFEESQYIEVIEEAKPGHPAKRKVNTTKLKALWSQWWSENKDTFSPPG
jgi:hypothetical protein